MHVSFLTRRHKWSWNIWMIWRQSGVSGPRWNSGTRTSSERWVSCGRPLSHRRRSVLGRWAMFLSAFYSQCPSWSSSPSSTTDQRVEMYSLSLFTSKSTILTVLKLPHIWCLLYEGHMHCSLDFGAFACTFNCAKIHQLYCCVRPWLDCICNFSWKELSCLWYDCDVLHLATIVPTAQSAWSDWLSVREELLRTVLTWSNARHVMKEWPQCVSNWPCVTVALWVWLRWRALYSSTSVFKPIWGLPVSCGPSIVTLEDSRVFTHLAWRDNCSVLTRAQEQVSVRMTD